MDWAQIQANALTGKKLTALTDLSAVLILSARDYYSKRFRWNVAGEKPTDSEWNDIEHAINQMEDEIMQGLIGAIIPHVMADISAFEALDCDGSTYLEADYPELYAAISPDLIIDATSFRVPNLNGRFPRGQDTGETVGFEGGENEVILTEAQLASHTHTNFPHSHSEVTAIPSLADFGTGAPVPSATPSVGVTGSVSVTIDNTGSNEPHNNEPQYTILRWLIIAK